MAKNECEFKNCRSPLGPGAVKIGYTKSNGFKTELRACAFHGGLVASAQPGTFKITDDKELKPIPHKRIII